ncbi:MBL fold metallo-hydrolase [Consotaella aegiceratis]|uniref:MBL fold metallo-hydrolase n=1 Tax=Consotaella aegiceratis TaxID=3097961 RepID=UPI002F403B3F
MADKMRFVLLGCASSPGVPRPTGDWGACDPANPKNRRTRPAALVQRRGADGGLTTIAIDCGPDFRQQMLSAEVETLDAVVITHPHADHVHGIDDVRSFAQNQKIRMPIHADEATFARLLDAFGYCFVQAPGSGYPPIAERVPIVAGRPFEIDGAGGPIRFLPFEQIHGDIHSLGFRIGDLSYCTDVSDFPTEAVDAIRGSRHVVIDALQYRTHPSHLSVDQALGWIEVFGVAGATFTHMHTPLDYDTLCRELPAHIRPGYDGLVLDIEDGG